VTSFQATGRHIARGFQLNAIDYVIKPFDTDVLRAKVAALLAVYERAADEKRRAAELASAQRAADRLARDHLERALVTHLAHELRTPLNAIASWAELLRSGRLDATHAARAVEAIARNARAQDRQLTELLDHATMVIGRLHLELQAVELGAIAEAAVDALSSLADERGVELRVTIERCEARGDPTRLMQVALNLIDNAVKFSTIGSTVEIGVGPRGSAVCLEVRDRGCGIAAARVPLVFERCGPAARGLGLGLSIARHVVESHGGSIEVDSAGPGRGATFTVLLPSAICDGVPAPVEGEVTTSHATAPGDGRGRLDGLRVLVVDDDCDTRELVATVVEQAGALAAAASSAAEAMAVYDRDRFDVMVSDLGMPDEDGYSLMRRLRRRGAALPAIALSAYSTAADREQALAAGFATHVPKPFDPEQLIRLIRTLANG
jgi:signal transduction histidine kinase